MFAIMESKVFYGSSVVTLIMRVSVFLILITLLAPVANAQSVAEAEIIEAQVLSTSPLSGQRIKDIDFPEGVLVGGVLKEGKLVMPIGSLRFDEGDEIALFVVSKDIPEVERLLQVSIDFF